MAFEYAGDLWVVPRGGGEARRLTATPEAETDPHFSPDGTRIAFTSTVRGNTDVYVVPTAGGEPTRLTYHPGVDVARGWSPDGRRVLFASSRATLPTPGANSFFRLWTMTLDGPSTSLGTGPSTSLGTGPSTPLGAGPSTARGTGPSTPLGAGGLPEALPIPRAFAGSYSPDGRRVAYEEIAVAMFAASWAQNQSSQWRHYRGGRTHPVRLLNLADSSVEKLPWTDSNDSSPMWVGSSVYFLSDRGGTTNLFLYRLDSKQLTQITHHDDFDIMSAAAGPDAVVYEQAGYLHLLDVASGKTTRLSIDVKGDSPWARPHFTKIAPTIRNAALSPTGVRAAFEARGEIVTVAAEKGDARNLTQSPGAHDRSPVWSPDGTQIAWLSDATGEYQLMIGDPSGGTKPRSIALPTKSFYAAPAWSPDGKSILLEDNHLHLLAIDLATGAAATLDTDTYDDPGRRFDAAWSPDSRWVAYSKSLDSHLRAIFLYSVAERRSHQITDGLSDGTAPVFDAGGKYLYFMASTNYALRTGWLEMSSGSGRRARWSRCALCPAR